MSLKYRADIDGLRAIAVLAVIFFHANIPGFSGGFVGVDVFFVISGFLITSIILKEIETGKFSIARFYERRIRRIFPALFPVIVFTLIVGFFLFDYSAFKGLGESVTATTLFVSNILFWRQAGYFDTASITKPLLHTWSLAVEEQFYIFFPVLLVAIHRFSKNRYLQWLIGIAIISLLTSIYGVYTHRDATFYLVPTRAWELLAGSILALAVIPLLQSSFQRNIFAVVGLVLIIYSVGFYTEATLFPGAKAIVPVFGTVMIIYSGMGGGATISKLLSLKPVVYIGLISYSLYLWHWPLFVFAKYMIFRELSPLEVTGIIMTTILISALSLKFIEQPFRGNQPVLADRKILFAFSAIVMVIASLIGGVIYFKDGMPDRLKLDIIPGSEIGVWDNKDFNEIRRIGKIGSNCCTPSFLLWGDSYAEALIPAFSIKAKEYKLSGFIKTQGGIPPLLGIDRNEFGFNAPKFNQDILTFIRFHPEIKTIILACNWSGYEGLIHSTLIDKKSKSKKVISEHKYEIELLDASLSSTVKTLVSLNRKVVLVGQIPSVGNDMVLKILWINALKGADYHSMLMTEDAFNAKYGDVIKLLQEQENENSSHVKLLPINKCFFDKNKLQIVFNRKILYKDTGHLSVSGSYFVSPIFDIIFKEIPSAQL